MKLVKKKIAIYASRTIKHILPKNLDVYQKMEVKYPFYHIDVEDFGLFIK